MITAIDLGALDFAGALLEMIWRRLMAASNWDPQKSALPSPCEHFGEVRGDKRRYMVLSMFEPRSARKPCAASFAFTHDVYMHLQRISTVIRESKLQTDIG